MRAVAVAATLLAATLAIGGARADDAAARKDLAPTGKLRVGIAVAPLPGAGNVARDGAGYRGVAIDRCKRRVTPSANPPYAKRASATPGWGRVERAA
jgi:hypothetical protein